MPGNIRQLRRAWLFLGAPPVFAHHSLIHWCLFHDLLRRPRRGQMGQKGNGARGLGRGSDMWLCGGDSIESNYFSARHHSKTHADIPPEKSPGNVGRALEIAWASGVLLGIWRESFENGPNQRIVNGHIRVHHHCHTEGESFLIYSLTTSTRTKCKTVT